jgi:hypothetical protein
MVPHAYLLTGPAMRSVVAAAAELQMKVLADVQNAAAQEEDHPYFPGDAS